MITNPLVVSSNSRYLTAGGVPFRFNCGQVWLATTRTTRSQWQLYLASSVAAGFNVATLMLVVQSGYQAFGNGNDPANRDGEVPFTTPGIFSTVNNAYFAYIRTLVEDARDAGVYVFLAYTYWGFDSTQGWYEEIVDPSNSNSDCTNWGVYIGNLLKDLPNVILMSGGDRGVSAGTGTTKSVLILNGIRSTGSFAAQWPSGNEWNSPDSLATSQAGFTYGPDPAVSNQNLATFYGCGASFNGQTYVTARASYAASPTLPSIMEEPGYYLETFVPGTRSDERKYHWWVATQGAAGQCWGSKYLWYWQDTGSPQWTDILTSDAFGDISRLFSFFDEIAWWRHRPSGTASGFAGQDLITSGAGSGNTAITSSVDSEGFSLIAFNPPEGNTSTRGYTVNMSLMAGLSRARWFNTTSGVYTNITGGLYSLPNSGTHSFTTPGDNGTGDNDWVLILDVPEPAQVPPIFAGMLSLQ